MKKENEVKEMRTQNEVYDHLKQFPPMPITKISAFLEEFPWVKRYVHPRDISRVFVSRIGSGLLDKNLAAKVGDCFVQEMLLLLDEKYELVSLSKKIPLPHRRFFTGSKVIINKTVTFSGRVEHWTTISKAFDFLGQEVSRIRFIFSYFRPTGTVIIYRPPKEFTITDWMRAQIETERKHLQTELQEIENEKI
jgi:hypothetical protein